MGERLKQEQAAVDPRPEGDHQGGVRPFYKAISNDWEDHLAVKHFAVEGQLEFRAILFPPAPVLPSTCSSLPRRRRTSSCTCGRLFIMDNWRGAAGAGVDDVRAGDRGDSEDLPLNISREEPAAEQDPEGDQEEPGVKKTLELLDEIAEKTMEDFAKVLHEHFGKER
eukprot:Sspe_Gene.16::Locus_4_Transcript_27_28_Confidence_0.095_Length_1801::g.16::m.16/K04079/HSP90A, htpG; molecular chaperone HtpG